jgi:hypothetical protein
MQPIADPPVWMLDTNIADRLLADTATFESLRRLMEQGAVRLAKTHVQDEEIADTPSVEKREALARLFSHAERLDVAVFALDYGNLDEDVFGGPEEEGLFDAVRKENPKHARDAMIAASAKRGCHVLVTDDVTLTGKVRGRAGSELAVWNYDRMRNEVNRMAREIGR